MTEPRAASAAPEPAVRSGAIVSFPLKVLTVAIGLLALAIGVGLLMGGRWRVERTVVIDAPPSAVFPWLDAPRRWDDWAPLGDVQTTLSGPEHGPGGTRRWNHPELGDGVFTIVATTPDREVRYHVEVQGGSLITDGTIALAPASPDRNGTRVTWEERGDFGHNPLMGYTARGMDRMQGAQMEGSLRRLKEKVEASR